MTNKETNFLELKLAELQFRLAFTVRLAITLEKQSLEVPIKCYYGKHTVGYEELALTKEQSNIAADYLKRTATYLMPITIKEALRKTYSDPKNHDDKNIVAAYQIARLIRNVGFYRKIWQSYK